MDQCKAGCFGLVSLLFWKSLVRVQKRRLKTLECVAASDGKGVALGRAIAEAIVVW
jgi:hypothetical protein